MKIAGMVLWVLTAGIGGYLLAVGFAAQRARQMQVAGELLPQDEAVLMGSAAVLGGVVPGAGGGRAEIEGSPLLEFVHPALALTGLTLWIFYTVSGDRLFAWVGFGIVVATVLAGVGWVLMTKGVERQRAARAEASGGAGSRGAGSRGAGSGIVGFPGHLVLLHGAAALCTIALVAVCLFAVVHL